jgi:formate C-acetyltransferase
MRKASSYDEVYKMFLDQFKFQVDKLIEFMDDSMAFYDTKCVSSMVLAGGYLESLETGSDPYKDVIKYMFFEIQSGAITPVADALAGIKKVVFEEKFVTMDELITALSKNFEGYEVLRKKLLAAPKFGNDDDYVDLIAKDISGNFCKWINDHKVAHKDRYLLPAIYSIFFLDHSFLTSATSDGRLCGDPIAVQFSPGPGRAKHGPTAVIQSVSKTDLTQGAGGSTVFLTISRNLVPYNAEGKTLVDVFFKAAVEYNVPVLSIAINDVEALKDAQKRPELYEDLVVRVWGFNARFVDLTVDMQNHIINRTVGAAG